MVGARVLLPEELVEGKDLKKAGGGEMHHPILALIPTSYLVIAIRYQWKPHSCDSTVYV